MKKALLFTLFAVSFANAQVLIDDNANSNQTPDEHAILELRSDAKALLLPRLNTSAINDMQNPQAGMMVFDKQEKVFKGYNGTKWVILPSGDNNQAQNPPMASNVNFTGDLTVGEQLQGDYTYEGDQTEGNSTFVWNSATDDAGNGKNQVATDKNYTLTSSEVGKYLQFCVTPVDNTSTAGDEQCSAWRGAVKDRVTPPQTGNVLLEDTFDDATGNSDWNGNTNFPIVEKVYQAEGAIRLASGKGKGVIISKELNFNGQNIIVA